MSKARRPKQQRPPVWRFYFVLVLLAALPVLLLARVGSLQVLDLERGRQFLKDQGEMRSLRTAEIPAYRGLISDRRGEPLAVSTPGSPRSGPIPGNCRDSARLAELAEVLDLPRAQLRDKLNRYRDKQFMYLRRHPGSQRGTQNTCRPLPGSLWRAGVPAVLSGG